ncbi:hypothetical protein H0O00_03440 [Candidatus Micrarchaeota archaeon]|nr:hypothetical protein [Candidatus Micrarchaeota archaeon]
MNFLKRERAEGRLRDLSYLLHPKAIFSTFKYLMETEPGSIALLRTVRSQRPEISATQYVADLHAHPYISHANTRGDFFHTLKIMVKNNVSALAVTTHGKGNPREMDFWDIKEFILANDLGSALEFRDVGSTFSIKHNGKRLEFIASYEMYVEVPGVSGRVDVVNLLPEKGFIEKARPGMTLSDYAKLNRDYDAIMIGAHPYTIWDPHGPRGFFRFRIASDGERKAIQDNYFPLMDAVDRVSSNCAWMIESNALLLQDFGKTLTNSDAHCKTRYVRHELGRAGNILKHGIGLREAILSGQYRNYLRYTPILQFLISIAFDKPQKDFP